MNTPTVHYLASLPNGQKIERQIALDQTDTLISLETKLFLDVKKVCPDAIGISLRVSYQDGSGKLCHYEKRGESWLRTLAENIVPTWFPFVFFGILGLLLLILFILSMTGIIK
jgi:hypothetical protein